MDIEIKEELTIIDDYELEENIQAQQPSSITCGSGSNCSADIPESTNTCQTSEDLYQFDEMQMLLKEWGLEILSERFVQNMIDVSILEYIVEMDIVDLCKDLPIRFRIILRHKLKQNFKSSHVEEKTDISKKSHTGPESSSNSDKHATHEPEISQKPQTLYPITTTIVQNLTTGVSNRPTNYLTGQPQPSTGQSKLVELLQQYESGRLFLNQYKIENGKRIYSAESRNYIKKALVDHYFRHGKGHISARQFLEMVQMVVEELPDEDPNIWYCVPLTDESSAKPSKRGLLYTRYRYITQTNKQYRKQKGDVVVPHTVVLAQQAKDAWEGLNGTEQTACLVAKSKLIEIENVDVEDVVKAWEVSYPLRRYEATMGQLKLDEYKSLTKFEKVHDLITQDFCLIHCIASESFYERIPIFVERFKTVYLGYKSLIEEDKVLPTALASAFKENKELTENVIFLAFYALPYILRQNFSGGKRKKRRKVSTMKVRLSFITLLSAEYMLLACVEDRKRIAAENDDPQRPFIVAIGSLPGDISNYYVVLDELIFPSKTIAQAVDLMFKLYTVFHMDYAQECKCVLQFIQGYLYDLKFQGVVSNVLATALITDFNRV